PVLEAACHERRIFVRYVLHAQGDGGVVKPPFPVVAAILGRRYRHNILFLAILSALNVFAAVFSEARHFCWRRRWEIERVVKKQVEGSPSGHFPRGDFIATTLRAAPRLIEFRRACQTGVVAFILAGPVHYRTDIQALHPCVCRTIVEDTKISPMPWQRTG